MAATTGRRALGRLATALATGAAFTAPREGARAQPGGGGGGPPRMRIGTYGGSGCPAIPAIREFEQWLGRPMDLVLDFLEKTGWDGMVRMSDWMTGCWSQTRYGLVVSVPMLVDEPGVSLQRGAAGAYDDQFRRLAITLVAKNYGNAILRLGWEFNGDWYRWSAREDPRAFAAFWRRIVLAMRGVPGGSRFRFDWNPSLGDGPTEAAWPGDDVVDVVGLDVYNQAWPRTDDPERRWRMLMEHRNGLRWHRDFAAAHRKPRSFAEWGTGTRPDGHGGGDDPLFVRNMLAWMRESGGGGTPVEYMCYWNYRAGDYDAKLSDGRLPAAGAALRAGLRQA
jgi:hypothetical protein